MRYANFDRVKLKTTFTLEVVKNESERKNIFYVKNPWNYDPQLFKISEHDIDFIVYDAPLIVGELVEYVNDSNKKGLWTIISINDGYAWCRANSQTYNTFKILELKRYRG